MRKKNLAKKIETLIENKQYPQIKKLLPPHPEDIAELIDQIYIPTHKVFVFRLVPYEKAVDVLEHLLFLIGR